MCCTQSSAFHLMCHTDVQIIIFLICVYRTRKKCCDCLRPNKIRQIYDIQISWSIWKATTWFRIMRIRWENKCLFYTNRIKTNIFLYMCRYMYYVYRRVYAICGRLWMAIKIWPSYNWLLLNWRGLSAAYIVYNNPKNILCIKIW